MAFAGSNFKHEDKIAAAPNGCLLWTGARKENGYGIVRINRRLVYVHRLAWESAHGPVSSRQCVCHRCNNKLCVNAAHLYLASSAQNVRDAWADGLCVPAARRTNAKLTPEIATEIRESSDSHSSLARRFGVSVTAVWLVRRGRTWKAADAH